MYMIQCETCVKRMSRIECYSFPYAHPYAPTWTQKMTYSWHTWDSYETCVNPTSRASDPKGKKKKNSLKTVPNDLAHSLSHTRGFGESEGVAGFQEGSPRIVDQCRPHARAHTHAHTNTHAYTKKSVGCIPCFFIVTNMKWQKKIRVDCPSLFQCVIQYVYSLTRSSLS